jgi:hypothetical protein
MARKPIAPRPAREQTTDDLRRLRGQQVRAMASTKTSNKAMAEILGLTVTELRKLYREELKTGHDYVYAAISMKLVNSAIGGDVRSMLAWLRQFGGWQEITRREITGKNGEPISFQHLDSHALASVIEALSAQGTAGRGAGRNAAQIRLAATDVIDLDAVSGSTDEGLE